PGGTGGGGDEDRGAGTHDFGVPARDREGEGADEGDGRPSRLERVRRVAVLGDRGAADRVGDRLAADLLGESDDRTDLDRVTGQGRVVVLGRVAAPQGERQGDPLPVLEDLVGRHQYAPPASRSRISARSLSLDDDEKVEADSVRPSMEGSRCSRAPRSDSRMTFFRYSRAWVSDSCRSWSWR